MFEVRFANGAIARDKGKKIQSESYNKAKQLAEALKDTIGYNFEVWEVKQVWTTQTLDETIKS